MIAKVISTGIVAKHNVKDCFNSGALEFVLDEPLKVRVDECIYRAPAQISTDGASTPRVFRNLVPRIGRHIYGAIIHDAAYRGKLEILTRDGTWVHVSVTREWADQTFYALMVSTNTGRFTRSMAYWAVRLFGRFAYQG